MAEVLTAITGSEFFPYGLATYTCPVGTGLAVERGPTKSIQLQWATYFDAADQAGQSRLWGGIHVASDDFNGRRIGAVCGRRVWALSQKYFDGTIANSPLTLSAKHLLKGEMEISATTVRGFEYSLMAASDLIGFETLSANTQVAEDWTTTWNLRNSEPTLFYRAVMGPGD
jgi:hypothetical protein